MSNTHSRSGEAITFNIYEDPSTPDYDLENDIIDSIEPYSPISEEVEKLCRKSSLSRRLSAHTTTSAFSSIPPSLPPSDQSPYTPLRTRPVFRHTSTVKTMQMATPDPFEYRWSSPRVKREWRDGTPRSVKSMRSGRGDRESSILRHHEGESDAGSHTPSRRTRKQVTHEPESERKDHPLILLHATLIPFACPYSAHSMEIVLPDRFVANFRLLEEKMSEQVLARGILIPHPREEYDVLEERLLESLELVTPRLSSNGHFYGTYGVDEDNELGAGLGSRRVSVCDSHSSGGNVDSGFEEESETAIELCSDCHKPVRYPNGSTGRGKKWWNVKIYAANGLMRAGAWGAAWKEMERIDVEITPWMPEDLRRELDRRLMEEEEEERRKEEEERRTIEEAQEMERTRAEAMRREVAAKAREAALQPQSFEQQALEIEEKLRLTPGITTKRPLPPKAVRVKIPLPILLRNYVFLLAQDKRNIALAVLSVVALLLAMNMSKSHQQRHFPAIVETQLFAGELQDCSLLSATLASTSTAIVTNYASLSPASRATASPFVDHGNQVVSSSETPYCSVVQSEASIAEASVSEASVPDFSSVSPKANFPAMDPSPVATSASSTLRFPEESPTIVIASPDVEVVKPIASLSDYPSLAVVQSKAMTFSPEITPLGLESSSVVTSVSRIGASQEDGSSTSMSVQQASTKAASRSVLTVEPTETPQEPAEVIEQGINEVIEMTESE